MAFSLKDWQRSALARMFISSADGNGNDEQPVDGSPAWSDDWKVLIYDTEGRDIVSPLLSVGELRTLGVTLHLGIESTRDAIPDVSAVYFVRPTPSNIRIIIDDAAAGKYRDASIHFITPIPRPLLEDLARGSVEAGAVPRLRRIVDQYQPFISLENRLFTLHMKESYAAYASPTGTDTEVEARIRAYSQQVAQALLSVCGTVGVVPLLVHSTGGPAEVIARLLEANIRDHLASTGSGIFSAAASAAGGIPGLPNRRKPETLGFGAGTRPVFLLVDRDIDMATPLSHPSTYQALIDDTLGPINLNRIFVPDENANTASNNNNGANTTGAGAGATSGGGWLGELFSGLGGSGSSGAGGSGSHGSGAKKAGKSYTLDSDSDPFWRNHAADEIPKAIDAHSGELQSVMNREEDLRRNALASSAAKNASALGDEAAAMAASALGVSSDQSSAADLVTAITSLPEIMKRKKILEMHASVLAAVMSRVGSRALYQFTETETEPLLNSTGTGGAGTALWDRTNVLIMIGSTEKGSFDDRVRLAAMYILTCTLGASNSSSGGGGGGGGSGNIGGGSSGGSGSSSLEDEVRAVLAALQNSLEVAGTPAGAAESGGTSSASQNGMTAEGAAQLARAQAVLLWIKRVRSMASLSSGGGSLGMGIGGGSNSNNNNSGGGTSNAGSGLLTSFARVGGNLLSRAAAQVNRMVGGETRLPMTRIVSAICEGKPSLATGINLDTFSVLDPRMAGYSSSSSSSSSASANRSHTYSMYLASQAAAGSAVSGTAGLASSATFRNAFVFVVGGGAYTEAHDIQKYAVTAEPRRTIVYGGTEMLQPGGFLAQLEALGKTIG